MSTETASDQSIKRKQVFICNQSSGEPFFYIGPLSGNDIVLAKVIGDFIVAELQGDEQESLTIELKVKELTEAEVQAIPEE